MELNGKPNIYLLNIVNRENRNSATFPKVFVRCLGWSFDIWSTHCSPDLAFLWHSKRLRWKFKLNTKLWKRTLIVLKSDSVTKRNVCSFSRSCVCTISQYFYDQDHDQSKFCTMYICNDFNSLFYAYATSVNVLHCHREV